MYLSNIGQVVPSATASLAGWPGSLSLPDQALLAAADPGPDDRVALFAPGALELACALLGRGIKRVAVVRPGDGRPGATQADIVLVPHLPSASHLDCVVACARRMLAPLGTLTIHLGPHLPPGAPAGARGQLLRHGFAPRRVRNMHGAAILQADMRLIRRLSCV